MAQRSHRGCSPGPFIPPVECKNGGPSRVSRADLPELNIMVVMWYATLRHPRARVFFLRTIVACALLALLAGCLRSSSSGGVTVIAPLAIPTNPVITPQLTVQVLPTRPLPVLGTPTTETEVVRLYVTPAGSLGPITLPPITETPTPYLSPTPSPTIEPTLPSPGDRCTHTVVSGDSLFAIALAYDTTVTAILAQNPTKDDEDIFPGEILWIPDCDPNLTEAELTATAIATSSLLPSPTPTLIGRVAQRHIVVAGDNLFQIALRYGVSMEAIIEINQLEDPDALSIGQELLIPEPDEP